MATDIDSLQIQLTATATKANTTIDTLVRKIDRLSSSLSTLNGHGLKSLASGVQQLGTAMQTMNNVKTADFTRLAKNLNTLSGVDAAKINSLANSVEQIGRSFSGLSGISSGATQMADLAKGISQLGYKSATQAITNIPRLATAMKQLMQELSRAPRVSQNLIDMTNALARLARTGASSGRAATSLSTAFDRIGNSSSNAHRGISRVTLSLSGLIKKLAFFVGAAELFSLGKQSIEIASDLTEVQNVVDTTFGAYKQKMEDLAAVSIPELGMSELTAKQLGSRFQAIGTALGFSQGKMADMSVALTRLTGDMASFYNVSQQDVGKALQSIFTGETEPMRRYGVDLTNATIQQWALNNGLNANVSSMSQAEKAMLRYQYVMERTSAAQGDFARTQDTWANQTRILVENLKSLGSTVGTALINVFKPLVSWLNSVMSTVISVVKTIVDALGAIFGWTLEVSPKGSTYDDASVGLDDIASSADGAGNSMGGAADKANELKKALMGFDEINKLPDETSSSGGSGGSGGSSGGSGAGTGTGGGVNTSLVKTDGIFEAYKSEIKNLEQLGAYIGNALSKAMESIDWRSIYKKARNFGTGLASFLNGLISPRLFGNLGKTIASSINTALEFLNSFGTTFNWKNFGNSIAAGINEFFTTTDFKLAADTFNNFANGILDSMISSIKGTDWAQIGRNIKDFIEGIEWTELLTKVGTLIWEAIKASIETWKGLFDGKGISSKITAVLIGLKFLTISKSFGNRIWRIICNSITGSSLITTKVAETGTFVGTTLSSAISAALAPSLALIGTAEIGKWLAEISDAARGGNGYLTEFGGILDSIGNTLAPTARDELFSLKEELEDTNASTETVVKKLVEFFEGKGMTSGQLEEKLKEVGGEINISSEQMEILESVISKLPKKSEKATTSFDSMKNALTKLQKDGVLPSNEHMSSLLDLLDKQQSSGSTAEETWSALAEQMGTMGVSIEDVSKSLGSDFFKSIGIATDSTETLTETLEKVDGMEVKPEIDVTVEDAKKQIDKFTKETSKKKIPVKTTVKTTRKQFSSAIEKITGKIKTYVETEIATKKDDFEKEARDKYSKVVVSLAAKIGTSPLTLKYEIGKMFSGYVQKINGKVDITELNDSLSKSQKTFGGTMNFTDVIKKNLSSDQKTINSTANLTDVVKKHLTSDKKTLDTIAKYTKSTDALPSSAKTFISTAKLTNTQDAIPSYKRVVSGVTAIVSSLSKVAGLSFSLKAAFSFLTNGLKLIFNKNGGVFNGGSWKPITAYAGGGLPNQGQMFVAREAGPELVGTLGGHTAVMNNNQIVSSVSAGVYQAVAAAISQYASQLSRNGATPNINVYVGGRQVTDVVVEEVNKRTKTTGMCPIMT